MNLVSRKLHWGHEIGRFSRCDETKGFNISKDNYYEFIDHLWDEETHENYVTILDDNENEITIPMDCFILSNDDKIAA